MGSVDLAAPQDPPPPDRIFERRRRWTAFLFRTLAASIPVAGALVAGHFDQASTIVAALSGCAVFVTLGLGRPVVRLR